MSTLRIAGLGKTYGGTPAVDGFSLDVANGEFIVLLGPSGCGKTTTLRMIAGFVQPTAGRILIGERDVTAVPPYRRDTGMVFQSYALFPDMTVRQNVAFGLEMRRVGRQEQAQRVAEALSLVRMSEFAERYPRQLSGGQQQRVALARAIVIKPSVVLLDEPLSNLDAKLRAEVRGEIRALQQRLGLTALMVTHDQEEALTMADRIVVMDRGRIRQIGTPKDIYERPADAFIAGFVGRCNLLAGTLAAADTFRTEGGTLYPCRAEGMAAGQRAVMAIRPDRVRLGAPAAGAVRTGGTLVSVNYLGAQIECIADVGGLAVGSIRPSSEVNATLQGLSPGDRVELSWSLEDVMIVEP